MHAMFSSGLATRPHAPHILNQTSWYAAAVAVSKYMKSASICAEPNDQRVRLAPDSSH